MGPGLAAETVGERHSVMRIARGALTMRHLFDALGREVFSDYGRGLRWECLRESRGRRRAPAARERSRPR